MRSVSYLVHCEVPKIKEHDCVVLTHDLPAEQLQAGDVGVVVHIHQGGVAYEVEFVTPAGEIIAMITMEAAHLRPIGKQDVSHVRQLTPA